MTSEIININKNELNDLIREIVREKLAKIRNLSQDEQNKVEMLYDDSLKKEDYSKEDCICL